MQCTAPQSPKMNSNEKARKVTCKVQFMVHVYGAWCIVQSVGLCKVGHCRVSRMCNGAVCVQSRAGQSVGLCKVEHCRESRMCNGAAQYLIRAPACQSSFAFLLLCNIPCALQWCSCCSTILDPGSSPAAPNAILRILLYELAGLQLQN